MDNLEEEEDDINDPKDILLELMGLMESYEGEHIEGRILTLEEKQNLIIDFLIAKFRE